MNIIKVDKTNLKAVVELGLLLFPENTFTELFDVYKKSLANKNEFLFLYQKNKLFVGYLHLSVRHDYVNGTDTSPVVFLEAMYVLRDYQQQGIGKEFVKHAEQYARQKGITQLASDCLIENGLSEAFHKSCGFIEKERVICFVKDVKCSDDVADAHGVKLL